MTIEVIAVGGYEEIGKNMTAIKVNDDVVIFDMGIHLDRLHIHEDTEDDGDYRHGSVNGGTHAGCDKDQTRQAQDHGVAGHHVCEQSDHQRERFGEQTDEFDQWHHRDRTFQPGGDFGPKDLFRRFP